MNTVIKFVTTAFWFTFFGLFIWMLLPKFNYIKEGIPSIMHKDTIIEKSIFVIHILAGTIVYIAGLLQFTASVRNRYISFHRATGKVYIIASVLCISSLFLMIPDGLCKACQPSQYTVTSLWLLFIVSAYYFIRKRSVEIHRRLMISSFICAAYFVSIRVVDRFAMTFFKAITKTEDQALLVSDITVWALPLIIFWSYWIIEDK